MAVGWWVAAVNEPIGMLIFRAGSLALILSSIVAGAGALLTKLEDLPKDELGESPPLSRQVTQQTQQDPPERRHHEKEAAPEQPDPRKQPDG